MRNDLMHQTALNPRKQLDSVRRHSNATGFTLIEVLIVVVIIGIIASIAVPTYTQFITDARRTDAITSLSELAGEQVRYFSNNNQYATSTLELGYDAAYVTPEGDYQITVSNDTPLKFLLTATPATAGRQTKDMKCTTFTLSNTGQKRSTGTEANCW